MFNLIPIIKRLTTSYVWVAVSCCSVHAQAFETDSAGSNNAKPTRIYMMQTFALEGTLSRIQHPDRYYYFVFSGHTYLMGRVTKNFHFGIYQLFGRSISSHNEFLLAHLLGVRSQYLFRPWPKRTLYVGAEFEHLRVSTQRVPDWSNPDSTSHYLKSDYQSFTLPAFVGARFLLNKNRNESLNIYWSPEVKFRIPIGYQPYGFDALDRVIFNSVCFTFEFKK